MAESDPQYSVSCSIRASLPDPDIGLALNELCDELQQHDLQAVAETSMKYGRKSALTTGIIITTLALTAVSTLVTVLQYWSSRKPRYRVTMKLGGTEEEVSGLDANGARKVAQRFAEEAPGNAIEVEIVRP